MKKYSPTEQALRIARNTFAGGGEAVKKAIKAYHGSPHNFDKFDLSKIGTGEGAQAYGHGLYFAENEKVADGYRKVLSPPDRQRDVSTSVGPLSDALNQFRDTNPTAFRGALEYHVRQSYKPPEQATAMIKDELQRTIANYEGGHIPMDKGYDDAKAAMHFIDNYNPKVTPQTRGGHMYEANINADPKNFLDWDKSVSKQSDYARSNILNALNARVPDSPNAQNMLRNIPRGYQYSGKEAYKALRNPWDRNDVDATNALREAGIPGIKYLDRGSRAAGDGSRNYVVFDDKIIDIAKKYGIGLPAAAALYQTMNPDSGQAQAATASAPVAAPNASQASGWNAGPSVPQQQTGIGAVSRQLSDWGERTASDVGDVAKYVYNNPGQTYDMAKQAAIDAAKWAYNNPSEAGGKAAEMVASGIPKFVPSGLWGPSGLLNPDPANGGEDTDALIARLKAKQSEQGQPDQTYQGYAHGGPVALAKSIIKVGNNTYSPQEIRAVLQKIASMGINKDKILAQITPREAAILKMHGGSGRINPRTGLPSFDDGGGGGEGGSEGGGGGNEGGNEGEGGYGNEGDSLGSNEAPGEQSQSQQDQQDQSQYSYNPSDQYGADYIGPGYSGANSDQGSLFSTSAYDDNSMPSMNSINSNFNSVNDALVAALNATAPPDAQWGQVSTAPAAPSAPSAPPVAAPVAPSAPSVAPSAPVAAPDPVSAARSVAAPVAAPDPVSNPSPASAAPAMQNANPSYVDQTIDHVSPNDLTFSAQPDPDMAAISQNHNITDMLDADAAAVAARGAEARAAEALAHDEVSQSIGPANAPFGAFSTYGAVTPDSTPTPTPDSTPAPTSTQTNAAPSPFGSGLSAIGSALGDFFSVGSAKASEANTPARTGEPTDAEISALFNSAPINNGPVVNTTNAPILDVFGRSDQPVSSSGFGSVGAASNNAGGIGTGTAGSAPGTAPGSSTVGTAATEQAATSGSPASQGVGIGAGAQGMASSLMGSLFGGATSAEANTNPTQQFTTTPLTVSAATAPAIGSVPLGAFGGASNASGSTTNQDRAIEAAQIAARNAQRNNFSGINYDAQTLNAPIPTQRGLSQQTYADQLALARTIIGEHRAVNSASQADIEGQNSLAQAAVNRAIAQDGIGVRGGPAARGSVAGQTTARSQFSWMTNAGDPSHANRNAVASAERNNSQAWQNAMAQAADVISGQAANQIGPSTMYRTPVSRPGWANTLPIYGNSGPHVFHTNPASVARIDQARNANPDSLFEANNPPLRASGGRVGYDDGGDVPLRDEDTYGRDTSAEDVARAIALSKTVNDSLAQTQPTREIQPDLMSSAAGEAPVGSDITWDEFNRPMRNGQPIQYDRRPSVLPLTRNDQGGIDFAMPRIADIAGNIMGGVVAPVTARAGQAVLGSGPVRRALEVAASNTRPVAQAARELSPLGLYSHGAETAAGLPQAKGTPEQMIANLRRASVKPEELYTSGIADETATLAKRTMIESEYAPKVEAAKQAMEGLVPGTPEFKAAERQFKNISSSMRSEMDNAMVLHPDWASRPSVTREELAKHFNERMPQIDETVLGGRGKPEMDEAAKQKWIEDRAAERAYNSGDIERIRDWRDASNEVRDWHLDEATSYFNELMATSPDFAGRFQTVGAGGATKFQQYTLPGGENYREVLLKLNRPQAKVVELEGGGGRWGVQMPDGTITSRYYEKFDAEQAVRFDAQKAGVTFTDPHWDDPDVLAHLRLSDRVGPNGEKILHVEEGQSGWGQKGRKEGFKQQPDPAKEKPLLEAQQDTQFAWEKARSDFLKAHEDYTQGLRNRYEQMAERWGVTPEQAAADNAKSLQEWKDMPMRQKLSNAQSEFMRSENPAELPHYAQRDAEVAAAQKRDEARNALIAYQKSIDTGIPTAPYVTSTQGWTDLALKRALREAAEGGYDKLVWTPGAEQAKRYSLSNQVDRLQYIKNDNGTYAVIPYKNGEPLHRIERDNIPEKELESLFGRDVAEKMRAYEGDVDGNARSLSGQNLEVGGSGMKGYYDKIWPNQLGKLVKKLDPEAKFEQTKISTGDDTITSRGVSHAQFYTMTPEQRRAAIEASSPPSVSVPSLTITPKMRESILRGQPHMADGGSVDVDKALQVARGYADGGGIDADQPPEPTWTDRLSSLAQQFNPIGSAEAGTLNTIAKAVRAAKGVVPKVAEEAAPAVKSAPQAITKTGADLIAKDPLAAEVKLSERGLGGTPEGMRVKDVEYKYVPNNTAEPWKPFNPEDIYKERGYVTPAVGDKTRAGADLIEVNGVKVTEPFNLGGGGEFSRNNPLAWASRPAAVKGMYTGIKKGDVPEGSPIFMSHTIMGDYLNPPSSSDSTQMMAKAILRQINPTLGKIDPKAAENYDDFVRNIAKGKYKDWPGILNPEDAERYLATKEDGTRTRLIMQALDTAKRQAGGLPNIGAARAALMEPRLLTSNNLSSGFSISELDPMLRTGKTVHDTYPVGMLGKYRGGTEYQIPGQLMFPEWWKGTGKITQPQGYVRSLMTQMPVQKATQEWLDNIMRHTERSGAKWGYRLGGSV